jgi:hypothetical protein
MAHHYVHTPDGPDGRFELFVVDEKEEITKHKETIPSLEVFNEKYPAIMARYVALRMLPPTTAGDKLGVHVQENLFLVLDPETHS